jgi:hypothetical protein
MLLVSITPQLWTTGMCFIGTVKFSSSIHYIVSFPANLFIQIVMSNPGSSACIATRRAVLVLVINSVSAITDHAGRRHSLLLHSLDRGVGRIVLGADLLVEAGVRGGLVERGDFGDVLAVGLAGVYDSLVGVWC